MLDQRLCVATCLPSSRAHGSGQQQSSRDAVQFLLSPNAGASGRIRLDRRASKETRLQRKLMACSWADMVCAYCMAAIDASPNEKSVPRKSDLRTPRSCFNRHHEFVGNRMLAFDAVAGTVVQYSCWNPTLCTGRDR